MRILMLNHNVAGVGTYYRCVYLAKALVQRDHHVTILTNSPHSRWQFHESEREGLRVIQSPDLFVGALRSGWDPVNAWRRANYLRREKFDVIHAFDSRPTVIFPALTLRQYWNCSLISDWCDWWGRGGSINLRHPRWLNKLFEPVETFFEEHYRAQANHVTTINEPLRQRAMGMGIPPEKVTVIPPVISSDERGSVDKIAARRELNLDVDCPTLVFSSFVLYDIGFLLAAFQKASEVVPRLILIITGAVPRSACTTRKGTHTICCVGAVPQDKLRKLIGASDVCLLPLSDHLANHVRFPDKLRNYLGCGRPVLTTEVGEAGKMVSRRKAGMAVRPTVDEFARGMIGMLAAGENQLLAWGKNALAAAEELFDGASAARLLERIYQGESVEVSCDAMLMRTESATA